MAKTKTKKLVIDGYEITEGVQRSRDTVKRLLADNFVYASVTKSSVPRLWMLEAWHFDYAFPLGVIWYRFIGKAAIEIQDSKTHLTFRRLGIRTWLHHKMVERYPKIELIFSQTGTPQGEAWMKKMGYKQSALGWQWERGK